MTKAKRPQRYTIEGPRARKPSDMSSWCRIVDEDGSTVAYAPNQAETDTLIGLEPALLKQRDTLKEALEKLLEELQGWVVADRMVPERVDEVARKEKWIRELQTALALTEQK